MTYTDIQQIRDDLEGAIELSIRLKKNIKVHAQSLEYLLPYYMYKYHETMRKVMIVNALTFQYRSHRRSRMPRQ